MCELYSIDKIHSICNFRSLRGRSWRLVLSPRMGVDKVNRLLVFCLRSVRIAMQINSVLRHFLSKKRGKRNYNWLFCCGIRESRDLTSFLHIFICLPTTIKKHQKKREMKVEMEIGTHWFSIQQSNEIKIQITYIFIYMYVYMLLRVKFLLDTCFVYHIVYLCICW